MSKSYEERRERQKAWLAANPEKRKATYKRHYDKKSSDPEWRRKSAEIQQKKRIRWKIAVIEKYGGCCAFCGSTQYEFLTIDHINNDGKEDRQKKYFSVYLMLSKSEFRPDLYRLLCWNCHAARTWFGVEPGGEELHDMDYWHEFSQKLIP